MASLADIVILASLMAMVDSIPHIRRVFGGARRVGEFEVARFVRAAHTLQDPGPLRRAFEPAVGYTLRSPGLERPAGRSGSRFCSETRESRRSAAG